MKRDTIKRMRLLLCLLLISPSVVSQDLPQMFQPGTISNGGVFGFTLSPDSKEAFWVQSDGGRDTLIIMRSVRENGSWSKPTPAPFSGDVKIRDIDPVFSPDGNTLLFQSDRPVDGKPDRKGFDMWAVKKTSSGWTAPYHLGNVINSDASESFASMARNGNIYFMKQNPDGVGTSDIYVATYVNGSYQSPENLGAPINTSFRESNPFIAPDEDYLIYFSSDTTGLGEVDLQISFRKNNTWTKPVNLGHPVNTDVGEFCPFVHENEKRLYFSRTIKIPGDRREENIFFYPFDVERYR